MSNKVKKIAKKLGDSLMFPKSMYSNFYGSYIIASYILNRDGNPTTMCKEWKRLERNPERIDMTSKDWLLNLCADFGVDYDTTGRIVMVVGSHNVVCLIADENGNIYPIREDGVYPAHSLQEALDCETIYRIIDDGNLEQMKNANIEGK
jgi:hypothetical protein